ncbi:MAG: DUF262 domain-containing HNH endonuclease family protein [Cyclobacteriaceae bacterium]|nr:DUF262 domain-containing HNH endonuclease family protein [Cyclobacteriaceae bacterium]
MAVGNFSTANQTYRLLMGNGLIYSVPRFQRDYSWTEEEWDDLWRDIENTLSPEGESSHYMGYLVLQSEDSKNFDIIDGQQRLTTLSIIILSVLANLKKLIDQKTDAEKNQKRMDQLRNSFIGYLDPVTLIPRSKLNLNRNNNSLYQNYLVPLLPSPKRNLKVTEHQMRKAYEWFESKIGSAYKTGENLAKFIDQLSDKLFFTVINVNDELNAYRVFETLNARGVKLSSTDLLKNYLFSVVHAQKADERELQELDNRWEILVSKLGSESFPDFLRTHWNSRYKFLRHSELFKRIRDSIQDRESVFKLIREMEADVDPYVALAKPEDELWSSDQKAFVKELRMFNVRQVYPVLLAAYRKFPPVEFTSLLRAVSIISFRYNVISNNPTSEQERIYNTVAEKISSSLNSFSEVINELRPLYPTDDQFKYAFAEKQLKTTQSRNRRVVRYVLFKIEKKCSGADYDFDSDQYNIEHILPESPDISWSHISDQDQDQLIYRLGNLTILNAKANRSIANGSFDEKKAAYSGSEFEITRRIASENSSWNDERIADRQRWLADQASSIWRISQLI